MKSKYKDNISVVVQFENDATPEEGRSEYNQLLQDTYCEEGLRKLNKKFIDGPENQYFVESCFTEDVIGVHQW